MAPSTSQNAPGAVLSPAGFNLRTASIKSLRCYKKTIVMVLDPKANTLLTNTCVEDRGRVGGVAVSTVNYVSENTNKGITRGRNLPEVTTFSSSVAFETTGHSLAVTPPTLSIILPNTTKNLKKF
jgi:hypothetical protein